MALDFNIPAAGYSQQISELDFWIRDLTPGAPVVTPANFEVLENVPIGTLLGTISATDPNGDDFVFSITAGNVGGAFAIDADSGELTVAAALDYEARASYSLTVAATDTEYLAGTAAVTITVLDIPEPEPPPDFLIGGTLVWRDAVARATVAGIVWQVARPLGRAATYAWVDAADRDAVTGLPWDQMRPADRMADLAWRDLVRRLDQRERLAWVGRLPVRDRAGALPWIDLQRWLQPRTSLPYIYPPIRDRAYTLPYDDVELHPLTGDWYDLPVPVLPGAGIDLHWRRPLDFYVPPGEYAQPVGPALNFVIEDPAPAPDATPPVALLWPPTRSAQTLPQPRNSMQQIPWNAPQRRDRQTRIAWGPGAPKGASVGAPWESEADDPPPPDPNIPTFPSLGIYTVNNDVSVVRLPERTPVPIAGLTAGVQIDSNAWSVQVTPLTQAGLDLINPDIHGEVSIEIAVNGFILRALIDDYSLSDAFGRRAWTASGRSRSAELGPPHAPARSFINDGLAAASQLATDELSGTGWALDWQAEDWNIAAGQFSYQNLTPLEAVGRLASAIGAVVQCDPASRTLHVLSLYRVSPWDWATETPEVIIPADVCLTASIQRRTTPLYNAVYVSGGTQGVNVNATRSGTAGDVPLPALVDALIVDVDAGTERARVELAKTGPRADETVLLPVMSPVGVVLPGTFAQVRDKRGIIKQTGITVQRTDDALDVQQSLVLERLP